MMRTATLLSALLTTCLLATGAHAQSVPWTMDQNHTHVGFTARHLGFAKVRGEFKHFTATIEADGKTAKLTKLSAEAETKTVDTGVEKRDEDLRSDHFFNAEKFPKLKLELKSIKWKGKEFTAVVSLTMRDVTKDVKFEGELLGVETVNFGNGPQQRAAYEANATVNRKEFGLNFNGLAEGISIVSDDVEINLEMEISLPSAAAPATAPKK